MLIFQVISPSANKEKDGMGIIGIDRIRIRKMILKANKIVKQCAGSN
jgi:hypothetical protein